MRLQNVCNPAVITAQRNDAVLTLAEMMREYHVGTLVIAENAGSKMKPVGLITDRDIVIEVLAKGLAPEQIMASDLLTRELVTASVYDEIDDVIQLMHEKQIRRLPVVDEKGCLFGIVSLDDLLQVLASELQALSALTRRQIFQEVETRS